MSKIFDGLKPRIAFESNHQFAKRALDFLMDKGVVDKSDMITVIAKTYKISRQTIYNAKRELIEDLIRKVKVLQV